MPCIHRFQEYLNLEKGYVNPQLNRIDFDPVTLIIGTFNPSWPEGNNAEWFYGRLRNNYLWDVLPRLYNHNYNLRLNGHNDQQDWKQFCYDNQIALTDMIYSINDADYSNEEHQDVLRTYLDSSIANYFEDFVFTDIINLLNRHPTIQNIYLTRQDGIELFDERWKLVEQYASENSERNLHVKTLLTPSASARFQIKQYKQSNPDDRTPLRNFIYRCWLENGT